MHGAAAVVELATAMVGHVDPLDPVIERNRRVVCRGDAFQDERDLVLVLDQLDGAPLQPLLEIAAGGAQAAFADVTFGDIALPAAVMRGVDGQAERGIAAGDGAANTV